MLIRRQRRGDLPEHGDLGAGGQAVAAVLAQDQRGALLRAPGLGERHVQLGGGDQPAVERGGAGEHRAARAAWAASSRTRAAS